MGFNRAMSTAATAVFVAAACDQRIGPAPVATSPSDRGSVASVAIALVSGNHQLGKAGEELAEPFVIRVTDDTGRAVSGVTVSFQVTSGAGTLGDRCQTGVTSERSGRTGVDGTATMTFLPTALGSGTVVARISTLQQSVTFATETNATVVDFWFGFWNAGFVGPCSNFSDVTVPVARPSSGGFRFKMTGIPSPTRSRLLHAPGGERL